MADRTISIKPFSRSATGSLALRVLYGGLALLGLPLLIHTLFLYRREYSDNLDAAFQALQFLGESRSSYLELMVHSQQDLLQSLYSDFPLTPEARNTFLENEATELHIDRLVYLDLDESSVCTDPLCKDSAFLQEARSGETFLYAKNNFLYVGRTVPSSGNPKGLFLVANDAPRLLALLEEKNYPMQLSLLDEAGRVQLTTGAYGAEDKDATWTPVSHEGFLVKSKKGTALAIKVPISGTGYQLLLTINERSIADLQMRNYVFRIATFLIFVCLLGGAILFWLTRRIAKPLKALGSVMQRVSDGSEQVRFSPDPMGFEINVLGLQLNNMLDAMGEHQRRAERERIARERLAQELQIGQKIQADLLLSSLPVTPYWQIAPGYLAAKEVSGDFYDLFVLPDKRLLITIADAADKGISACLFALSFRSMLRTAAATQKDLASIVVTANQLFVQDAEASSFFITAWIGLYDPKTEELCYCSQGHPPAYLRKKNGELQELTTNGLALGIDKFLQPSVRHIAWKGHDLLLLYTDGVIEAHDPDGQLFGKKRLQEFLHRCKALSAESVVDQLLEEIHLFCRGAAQADDVTLLAVVSPPGK